LPFAVCIPGAAISLLYFSISFGFRKIGLVMALGAVWSSSYTLGLRLFLHEFWGHTNIFLSLSHTLCFLVRPFCGWPHALLLTSIFLCSKLYLPHAVNISASSLLACNYISFEIFFCIYH
jgi:hypothetical protein